jgi:hypothetical protein
VDSSRAARLRLNNEVRRRHDELVRPQPNSLVEDAAGGDPITYEDAPATLSTQERARQWDTRPAV